MAPGLPPHPGTTRRFIGNRTHQPNGPLGPFREVDVAEGLSVNRLVLIGPAASSLGRVASAVASPLLPCTRQQADGQNRFTTTARQH
jgi:hypothetical protein